MNDFQHTLLFVDDEENILHSLKRLLRKEGYRILTASSGADGLAILKEFESHHQTGLRDPGTDLGKGFIAGGSKNARCHFAEP
jgi:CheY-like chemotaxis protein